MKTKTIPANHEPTSKGSVPVLVRRCFNCIHSGKGFKAFGATHHHCSHPATVAGIENWNAWDTLVEWHHKCANWEPKKFEPNDQGQAVPGTKPTNEKS